MNRLYKYIGIEQKRNKGRGRQGRDSKGTPPGSDDKSKSGSDDKSKSGSDDKSKSGADNKSKNPTSKKPSKIGNFGLGLLTMVKRIQMNYNEINGTYLPGYLQSPGFIGTLKPTLGYTFGSQRDIRDLAARNGWLTRFPEFNQQYTETHSVQLDYSVNIEPFNDFKIDLVGNRIISENFAENYNVNNVGGELEYESLTPNNFGNFTISTMLIKTAFSTSDEFQSQAFDDFEDNRLTVANRLALERGIDISDPANLDTDGFPLGYGKTSQAVLLPSFLSAYSGQDAGQVKLTAFRDVPIPNWDIKYTGLMKFAWFKQRFKRFSLTHGYRSNYTINQFRTNLDYDADNPDDLDQNGNFKNEILYSNINLTEMFSPLIRIDFETKSAIKLLLELKKDRLLSLSFDNNLVTEIQGYEYKIGLGYRIKDVRIKSKLAGPNKTIISDLNFKADLALRDNKTIIRYLDLDNNQITSGQSLWSGKLTADYAFSKNLTGIFYFDYTFSEYAISTAFPQTTIRSGITLRYNFGN